MTIVLLHGWGCSSNAWQPLLSELEKISSVLNVELPGFGAAPSIENFSLDAVANLIATQIPDNSTLIGWSLGGMLAVHITARYPRKVSRVITLATNAKFVADTEYTNALPVRANQQFNTEFANNPTAALSMFTGLLAHGDEHERLLLKKIRHLINAESINKNWLQALELLAQLDNRQAFAALKQTGLHLLGGSDALVPAAAAKSLVALNPTQKIVVIPHTAHAIHWSRPEKVIEHIQNFFQQAERSLFFLPHTLDANTPHQLAAHTKPIKKEHIALSFSRAALTYDAVADFQRSVGQQLVGMLKIDNQADVVIDLGCGTGHFTSSLQEKFKVARIIGIDLAEGMLSVAQKKNPQANAWLCGDAENLPIASSSVDVIFSNLALQWCNDLPSLFAELNRVLKPQGLLVFSTLGPSTLHELKSAWHSLDSFVHVNQFQSLADVNIHLKENYFSTTQSDRKITTLHFEKLSDLTRELKALGAHNINKGRATGLTGRKKILELKSNYEQFRCENLLPATYEVIHIVTQKAE